MTEIPTDVELDAIEKRWNDHSTSETSTHFSSPGALKRSAASANDVPALLAAVRQLRADLEISTTARTVCRREHAALADAARDFLDALDADEYGDMPVTAEPARDRLHGLLSGQEAAT